MTVYSMGNILNGVIGFRHRTEIVVTGRERLYTVRDYATNNNDCQVYK